MKVKRASVVSVIKSLQSYALKPVRFFSVRWCHATFCSGVDTSWERCPSSLLMYVWRVSDTVRMVSLRREKRNHEFQKPSATPAPTMFSRETTETWSVHSMVMRGGRGGKWALKLSKKGERGALCLREKADVVQVDSTKATKCEKITEEINQKRGTSSKAYWKWNDLRQDSQRSSKEHLHKTWLPIPLKANSKSLTMIVPGPWLLYIFIYPPVFVG